MQFVLLSSRASLELTERIDRLATAENRSRSQKMRMMLEKAVSEEEQALGLPPITEGEKAVNDHAA
ncbi:CopG family transcriptional regulator [Endozoicomonas ascidiicola]|uniref:ribbon-helix-helix domain-containing protein n=1 Tax=Endozoicomonas ascidiicola TaxID=1698521 RepID=UPI00082C2FDC|nr:CopG family transcriptional regulator [Endozoicomonas ascidiicola]